ncbi:TPA: phosphotransferase family protein [Kluyvera georgiana]
MTINIIADVCLDVLARKQVEAATIMAKDFLVAFKESNPSIIKKGSKINVHVNQGGMGHVFDIVNANNERLILKFTKEQANVGDCKSTQAKFNKELWIATRTWSNARPPKIISVGEVCIEVNGTAIPYAFILQEFSPYIPAYEGLIDRKNILNFAESVGEITAEIHSLPTSGFGEYFSSKTNNFLFNTWMEFIDDITNSLLERDSFFCTLLTSNQISSVAKRISDLRERGCESKLFHGDCIVNWGNLLVDTHSRKIRTIIDWEYAGGGDALIVDMGKSLCTLYERMPDSSFINEFFDHFLSGYGMNRKIYNDCFKRDVESFAIVLALQKIREMSLKLSRSNRRGNLERLIQDIGL